MALTGASSAKGDGGGESHERTILVVEDDANTRRVLVLLLEIRGYQVVQSSDGEAGLGVVRAVQPDLVVSDLQLPDMSGIELAATIRRSDEVLPVIAITSGPESLMEEARQSHHFRDVLKKPIDVNQLLELVDGLMTGDGA